MKNFTLLLVVFFIISFVSCRKNRTCTCDLTTVSNAPSGTSTTTSRDSKTLLHVNNSEARTNCLSQKYSYSYYTIAGDSITDTEVKCSLN